MNMRVVSVVGARPQFIKAAMVSKALREAGHIEILVHTGQHYDYVMSQVFFDELGIPEPDYNLEVGSGPHGAQMGQMLGRVEQVLQKERPDWVLVYGDTNTTLAGALAAAKLHIPVAHVEAGLRSFNRRMPEEINRVLTDHVSMRLFCPTETAVRNLAAEGITQGVHLVGDVMYDAVLHNIGIAEEQSKVLETLGLRPGQYHLATVHRPENTDQPENLRSILAAFVEIEERIIFPVHPRTRQRMVEFGLINPQSETFGPSSGRGLRNPIFIDPMGYLDMLVLEKNARVILTDSGGVQKEAYWFGVPCVTLREETEWVETVQAGWNRLAGTVPDRILHALSDWPNGARPPLCGEGGAAQQIAGILTDTLGRS